MTTRIAIAVWRDTVSTVLDFCRLMVIVDLEDGREVSRDTAPCEETTAGRRVARLQERGVQVLICGAISEALHGLVTAAGIEVVAFVTGPLEEVLAAYQRGRLDEPRFLLPGSPPDIRRRLAHAAPSTAARPVSAADLLPHPDRGLASNRSTTHESP